MNPLETRVSRRVFNRTILTIGTGVAAVLVGCGDEAKPNQQHPTPISERQTLIDTLRTLEGQPTAQKIKSLESMYGGKNLTPEITMEFFVPLWAQGYIEASNSRLTVDELVKKTVIGYFGENNPEGNTGEVPGLSPKTNNRENWKIFVNLSKIKPYQDRAITNSNVIMTGVATTGATFMHELGHFDSKVSRNSNVTEALMKIFDSSDIDLKSLTSHGLTVRGTTANGEGRSSLSYVEEMVVENITCDVRKKLGLISVDGYVDSENFRIFTESIGISADDLRKFQRESDLEGFALKMTEGYLKMGGILNNQNKLEVGLSILDSLNQFRGKQREKFLQFFPNATYVRTTNQFVCYAPAK